MHFPLYLPAVGYLQTVAKQTGVQVCKSKQFILRRSKWFPSPLNAAKQKGECDLDVRAWSRPVRILREGIALHASDPNPGHRHDRIFGVGEYDAAFLNFACLDYLI